MAAPEQVARFVRIANLRVALSAIEAYEVETVWVGADYNERNEERLYIYLRDREKPMDIRKQVTEWAAVLDRALFSQGDKDGGEG